jgi:hypothetical protein
LQRLVEHEEQFRAVIARERGFDLGLAFLNSIICQRGQFSGIAFTCQNRIQNRQPTVSADVTEHMMQVEVHLVKCLLHVLNKHPRTFDQVLAMSLQGA